MPLCDNVGPVGNIVSGVPLRPPLLILGMELTVRFFALYRERAGRTTFPLQLPEGATVSDLTAELRRHFPNLAPTQVQIVVAVNADYAEPEVVLQQGDDVCLIPPVSGG